MPSVLFVCTAKVCRSPMAEGLFRARLGEDAGRWRVESAGTWARNGDPAASRAQLVLQERGIDLPTLQGRDQIGKGLQRHGPDRRRIEAIFGAKQRQRIVMRRADRGCADRSSREIAQ